MKLDSVRMTAAILGDKWTPQLICAIAQHDSIRFCKLQSVVGGINPRTLTAKLVKLEESGVITRNRCGTSCEYSLTEQGRDLLPALSAMSNWSDKHRPALVS